MKTRHSFDFNKQKDNFKVTNKAQKLEKIDIFIKAKAPIGYMILWFRILISY